MIKRFLLSILLFILWVTPFFSSAALQKTKTIVDTLQRLDSATFLIEIDAGIHAIAFDQNGKLFLGGNNKVYVIGDNNEIETYATLTDTTSNTVIWGMTFDSNGNLYAAAYDRVVKIDTSGTVTTVINEDFGGPCGVSDIRIDPENNLYVAYDNKIARYDTALNKKVIINGEDFNPPIEWAVGLEFDDRDEYMYVGDCNGKKLFVIPYRRTDFIDQTKTFPSNWGQYLAKDEYGNMYLSMHGPDTFPEFLMLDNNHNSKEIYMTKRPYQTRGIHKKAIAYGQHVNHEKGIYCIIGNKVYIYPINKTK